MLESKYKRCTSFYVDGPPPWKASPGPMRAKYEPERKQLVEKLRREAYRVKEEEIFFSDEVALTVTYARAQKARDPANIIGGIADALTIAINRALNLNNPSLYRSQSISYRQFTIIMGMNA
ncbi:unnamed protein product [marine sediment metagenome]|uniref:Uncharacterized protein n=1 Tax=marine sediment metagenome TaxID=412755 RepID=X1R5S0_9ZZZZ